VGSVTYYKRRQEMMKQHVYKFEFNYSRMVNGKKTKFVIPIVVHDVGYVDACCRVDEHVKKNFGDRVSEDSLIKYVGEFIEGEFKPFVEMKEEKQMKTYLEMYDEMVGVNKKVELLENRIEKFEKKQEKLKPVKTKPLSIKTKEDLFGEWYCREDVNMMKKICVAIENKRPHVLQGFDMNSMYPQAVDVCKVYRIERDQALKENEVLKDRVECLKLRNKRLEVNEKYYDGEYRKLSDEKKTHEGVINWYKKEFGRLNLIIDDMENRLEKEVVDVCKVYQIERDQALKENEALQERIDWISADSEKVYENIRFTDMENSRLLIEVSGYKKELSQLNLLMDDMENRLEKQVVAREGMLKQLREYKAEKKRMNKIIDALTEDK
jgi:hypothetical protein